MSQEFDNAEFKKMLLKHIIKAAQNQWVAPVVFVTKKDGALRICVDHSKQNALIGQDSYPIPRMGKCVDWLGKATLFLMLDAKVFTEI